MSPPGFFIYAQFKADRDSESEVGFFIREEPRRIHEYIPLFQLNSAVLADGHVLVVPLILRIGPDIGDNLFEMWLNLCDPQALAYLDSLARQKYVHVIFFGDNCQQERVIKCRNSWKEYFADAIVKFREWGKTWTDSEFMTARRRLMNNCPTVTELCLFSHSKNPGLKGWPGENALN